MAKRGAKRGSKARVTKRTAKSTSKASPKKKRRLSKSPEAIRARAYRLKRKQEAAIAAAASARKKKSTARKRKRARLERESLEQSELARLEEEREAESRRSRGDERQLLADVLDDMRNIAAAIFPISMSLTEAEVGAKIPWLVVGRFDPIDAPTYGELDEIFAAWRDDLVLEARIHPQRLSQIRIVYNDPNAKRGEGDSIVSHSGPWEAVISEITFELDPDDEDSLARRYDGTRVPNFYVYFSGHLATEVEISL